MRQTSLEVYHKIKDNGVLSERRMEVYNILFHHGPLTATECWEIVKQNRSDGKTHQNGITPRFSELLDMQAIYIVEERPCSITREKCISWDVTNSLPVKLEKKPTKEERIKELEKEVSELKFKLSKYQSESQLKFSYE